MGSSPSSQRTGHHPPVQGPPVLGSRRNSHPGSYVVPVFIASRLPPHPSSQPLQSVRPVTVQFSRQDSWNESRDLTFCRILGAEEFLGRMLEQDELLRQLSQREDREELTPQIVETLGLRGHLQGELVRIERMLAENDPELKSIANYEVSNAAVVEVLREIRDEAKRLRDSEMQTETEAIVHRKSVGTIGTTDEETGVSIASQGVQTNDGGVGMIGRTDVRGDSSPKNDTSVDTKQPRNGLQSKGVAVGDGGFTDSDRLRDVATETDLAELHKQEELQLAERFARRIAGGPRQLSSGEVNAVLGDHAKSVQALKRRHDLDRQKLLRRLEQRKMELNHRNNNSDDDNDDDDDKQVKQSKRDERVDRNELGELVDENSRTQEELRRVKALEKQRIQEMLSRKKKGLMNVVSEEDETGNQKSGTSGSSGPDLDDVARTLEFMRLRGELSEETMSNILHQYKSRLNGSSRAGAEAEEGRPRRKNKHNKTKSAEDENATRDAVQRLVQDNQLNTEEIQKQRQMEKELIERKLQLKLGTRNQGSSKAS